jgi:signal transduction histidine kinase
VRVERTPVQLRVSIEDNGIGPDAAANRGGKRPQDGLGLRGLRRRIEGLGGNLTLLPRASRGTAMVVTLPLGEAVQVPANVVKFRDSA